ncbi:restriction endonuclease subunit S, partial [Escherichia coli]|nr:restriction endonuclease subunit S [Escherichia coli]
MSQWIKTKLGEIVILNYGKALKAQDRNAGSIPVYSSGGLTGWHN